MYISSRDHSQNHTTRFSAAVGVRVDGATEATLDKFGRLEKAGSGRMHRRWQDFGWAVLYMSPALALFLTFTHVPFVRSLLQRFYVTTPTGEPAHFNSSAIPVFP